MKTSFRSATWALATGVLFTFLPSAASAGCGDLSDLRGPFTMSLNGPVLRSAARVSSQSEAAPTIVGLWSVKYIAQGNSAHNPPIPDGALVDWGYSQWHGDGTEILNSGGHTPATQNFCLGVWGKTGFLTYELNHFALSYDLTSQALAAYVNIREQVTLSPSGDVYTGPFTIDVYDPKGNHVDHIAGTVTGQRITVDTAPF